MLYQLKINLNLMRLRKFYNLFSNKSAEEYAYIIIHKVKISC